MKALIPILALSLLIQFTAPAVGQAIRLHAPEGWSKERIPLPPPFAPKMSWKGVEEVRFAPGMFRPQSDSFFSYVLVFQLVPKPKLDAATLQREILVYYRGLAAAVLKDAKVSVDADKFTLKIAERGEKKGVGQYEGDLEWVEPFVTRKSQFLHLEVDVWSEEKSIHNYVFICASPKDKDSAIWRKMRTIRDGFRPSE